MSKITVDIRGEQKVVCMKRVEMERADYDECQRILESDMRASQIDAALDRIVSKYGLCESQADWSDMEAITVDMAAVHTRQEGKA